MKIFLIGYKCSGKSTTGPVLAKKLGFEFIDLDAYIESKHNKTIPDLFNEVGEINFRQIERDAFFQLLSEENAVIATGGGFPCWFNNMDILKRSGIVVYFKVDSRILFSRMQRISHERPVLKGRIGLSLRWHINKLIRKYGHIYNNAHILHENNSMDVDPLVHKIKLYQNALIY